MICVTCQDDVLKEEGEEEQGVRADGSRRAIPLIVCLGWGTTCRHVLTW